MGVSREAGARMPCRAVRACRAVHDVQTPHTSLDNITPNDAITDPKKRMHVIHQNILKAKDNGFVADLKPGDKVRVEGCGWLHVRVCARCTCG